MLHVRLHICFEPQIAHRFEQLDSSETGLEVTVISFMSWLQRWWSRTSVEVDLNHFKIAIAVSRHINQKPIPDATRVMKNRVSSCA
jgi:hypothetical protein